MPILLHGMAKKYFDHPHERVRVWAKLAFEISLKGTLNLISTGKIEIFWGSQKDFIHHSPFYNGSGVPKTHQTYTDV
jgi:hypothetical protein